MKKFKAVMYVRLSNSDDLKNNEESNSITNQKKLIEEYVLRKPDIELVSEKVDDGYSGIVFERPAFNEMISEIEKGVINCVIVKDLSRFGREYIETGRYLQRVFPALGVRFIAINDNIDTFKENSANDSLLTSFKSIINDSYCRDISIKTRTALEAKRLKGDYLSPSAKYGYLKSKENKNKLVIDEYASRIVKDIYRMKIDGYSAMNIAKKMNELGVLSPIEYKKQKGLPYSKGGFGDKVDAKWSATSIIRILSDEIYIGNLIQGKQTTLNYKLNKLIEKQESEWVRVENTHEPIISKEVFDIVKKLMLLDTRTAPQSKSLYLFSGILICGYCGNRMTRKIVKVKDKKYIYYVCPITKKQGCDSEMIREDKLIECVFYSLKAQIEQVIINNITDEQRECHKAYQNNEAIVVNKNKIEELNIYKSKLYENLIDGLLTKDEYKKFKKSYDIEIDEMEKNIDKLKENTEKNIKMEWYEDFIENKKLSRKIVSTLISSIIIENKNMIKINYNFGKN